MKMIRIIYTNHANERVKSREINKSAIEDALNNPDKIVEENDIKICYKGINSKILRVVYKMENNAYIVITAYLTTKKKYRRGNRNENRVRFRC